MAVATVAAGNVKAVAVSPARPAGSGGPEGGGAGAGGDGEGGGRPPGAPRGEPQRTLIARGADGHRRTECGNGDQRSEERGRRSGLQGPLALLVDRGG